MSIFKCKMCGGDLEVIEGQSVCECVYCGTQQTLPRLDSDKKANLYDRANHFRRNNDYDKAMSIYEQILNEDSTDAEAYWSLVLCKYGIEYVEDPGTHKRIPTINRAQYTSIFADENYKAALEHADMMQKSVYESEAKAIDEIQKGILAISEKEEPFDVFICYKETDENGRRTQDSVLANDLYHQLAQEGFKVFFAKITLEDKLGQEYEPYIFAALNSAKAMVVLGTKPEYFKAVWVKNEWSRYLALISGGARKTLIPAYRDMDPYDLPEEFSHLQAQDMSKLGFMQDLIRGIRKIIGADEPVVSKETVVVQHTTGGANSDALLRRGNMALEDGEWEKADEFFEDVLNQQPECSGAYLGKLLVKCRVHNLDALALFYSKLHYDNPDIEYIEACEEAFEHIDEIARKYAIKDYLTENEIRKLYEYDRQYTSAYEGRKKIEDRTITEIKNERLYARAIQYACESEQAILKGFFDKVTENLEQYVADAKDEAIQNKADVTRNYEIFIREADKNAEALYEKAEGRKNAYYCSLIKKLDEVENAAATSENRVKVFDLIAEFRKLGEYKEAFAYSDKCEELVKEIDKKMEDERETLRLERETKRKKIKKIAIICVAAIVAVVAFIIVYRNLIIPAIKYNKAVSLQEEGRYYEAYNEFREMRFGYRDVASRIQEIESEFLKAANIGDSVPFGTDGENWIVLDKRENKVLVISEQLIAKKQYHEANAAITWGNCTLRKWLNDEYLNSAFSDSERKAILSTTVVNKDNAAYGTAGGNDTTDYIFLLSIDEVKKYLSTDEARVATYKDGGADWWWLRSPGRLSNSAADVYSHGSVSASGNRVRNYGGVRPAFWIDSSNL